MSKKRNKNSELNVLKSDLKNKNQIKIPSNSVTREIASNINNKPIKEAGGVEYKYYSDLTSTTILYSNLNEIITPLFFERYIKIFNKFNLNENSREIKIKKTELFHRMKTRDRLTARNHCNLLISLKAYDRGLDFNIFESHNYMSSENLKSEYITFTLTPMGLNLFKKSTFIISDTNVYTLEKKTNDIGLLYYLLNNFNINNRPQQLIDNKYAKIKIKKLLELCGEYSKLNKTSRKKDFITNFFKRLNDLEDKELIYIKDILNNNGNTAFELIDENFEKATDDEKCITLPDKVIDFLEYTIIYNNPNNTKEIIEAGKNKIKREKKAIEKKKQQVVNDKFGVKNGK